MSAQRRVSRAEVERLREQIRRHDYLYYVRDRPAISDDAYDRLAPALQCVLAHALNQILKQHGIDDAARRRSICENYLFETGVLLDQNWLKTTGAKRVFPRLCFTDRRLVEDEEADPALRARAAEDVKRTVDEFLAETGWHPTHIAAAAGALLYSKYNFVIRLIMKRISKKAGGPVDTSRDYEFTDWTRIDQLTEDLIALAR